MEKERRDGRWRIANSTENTAELRRKDEDDEDEEEEEALSLSDLPLINQSAIGEEMINIPPCRQNQAQDDFDFCSFSKESEMCAADEVFYRGQILPLRHSVSSVSISRSESLDRSCSGRLISSRSSSISSSHQSSTSGSSSSNYRPKLPPRIQFHSHPSPSPRLFKQGTISISSNQRNSVSKSSVWNILRLGLVATPPEIAFQDLKIRCSSTNFGSRNSTSSNCSSASSTKKKKKKSKAVLGGCRCAADAVDTKVVIMKRSASDGAAEVRQQGNVEKTKKQAAKKMVSHRRTFEWLKQLSVEGNGDEA